MSPCEPLPSHQIPRSHAALPRLSAFGVTSNGFLPEEAPIDRLQSPNYEPWETLIRHLPESLQEGTLRAKVNSLPTLSASHLTTEPEWRRAYLILCMLTHAYIWGGDTPCEILPPPLSLPLLRVSSHLGLPPVATYASLNLWNFRSTSPTLDFSNLDALEAQHTMTGTPDESWFYMVSVAMEAHAAPIIPTMLHALDVAQQPYPEEDSHGIITYALEKLTQCIDEIGQILERMDEKCDPQVFFHRIRPFLAGSRNMAAAGLPRGVFYDEGEGKGEWRQLRGGSNGQSSLVQFLDAVLGVEHSARGSSAPDTKTPQPHGSETVSFHEEVRGYMPAPHRLFLEYVTKIGGGGGMRKAITSLPKTETATVELREAFRRATAALTEFRNKHLRIVTRYIIVPSRQQGMGRDGGTGGGMGLGTGAVVTNLATASASARAAGAELTGTGGTALLPFLKQTRDETARAGERVR
ncbi:Indoleamine 2,3-dioxygenase [Cercophora scortea]|uniref:Indoleamine 2,3-dioxygenase n=1 Tax=Cercophora scortea TaxID=314031 RepID=A0AAE0MJ75_9PEZI|nr:Indoleamine 2,3-dioxygenase [Cercophora scortea]